MQESRTKRKEPGAVIQLAPRQKRRAPRRGGPLGTATAGSLALATATPAPVQAPVRFPTPSRWFSEKNGSIGFRLYDILYIFAMARQAMAAEDAIEWGARYFAGGLSEDHARTVLDLLAPGHGDEPEAKALAEAIRQSFRDAICQGAGRLLGRSQVKVDGITVADAEQLSRTLERLYESSGWLLPAIPYTLHRMLRYSKEMEY